MYHYETSTLPLHIIQIAGALDETDLQTMEAGLRWSLSQTAPYVCLTLARFSERPASAQRRRIAEITEQGKGNKQCLAVAIVVANELVAGALTAIRWMAPSPRPEKSFTNATAALAWLQPYADGAGLVIGESARSLALRLDTTRPGV